VKEVFTGIINFCKNYNDTIASAYMLNITEKEFAAIPESGMNKATP